MCNVFNVPPSVFAAWCAQQRALDPAAAGFAAM
jgi:hypothetical protein